MRVKYLILGAGPAGLSLACSLLKKGEKDFFILEKNNEVGGLCRSRDVDGAPLDIGGGHFLDVRNQFFLIGKDFVLRKEILADVNAEVFLRQIAHMTLAGDHRIVFSYKLLNGFSFSRGFNND